MYYILYNATTYIMYIFYYIMLYILLYIHTIFLCFHTALTSGGHLHRRGRRGQVERGSSHRNSHGGHEGVNWRRHIRGVYVRWGLHLRGRESWGGIGKQLVRTVHLSEGVLSSKHTL